MALNLSFLQKVPQALVSEQCNLYLLFLSIFKGNFLPVQYFRCRWSETVLFNEEYLSFIFNGIKIDTSSCLSTILFF